MLIWRLRLWRWQTLYSPNHFQEVGLDDVNGVALRVALARMARTIYFIYLV
jgi:hypothetical protein